MRTKETVIVLCLLVLIVVPSFYILYTQPMVYLFIVGIPCSVIIGGALSIRGIKRLFTRKFKR